MRGNLGLFVSSADRERLAAIIADRNSPQKHVWRAQVVLLTGDRVGTNEIIRRTGLGKVSVWRWQERYVEAGVDGLLRDKTRPSRIPKLADAKVAEVIRRTQEEAPPDSGTHWTVRAMAAATGVSRAKVHVIWREAGLVPHRWRQFKLSNDPAFAEKVEDVVGLYVDPPEHAVVLSIDEKSQIQALDRTQPGLPMKKGRLGTMTHDDKRNGTTTLFAALNVLEGKVIGRNMQRHRHQEFIRFLNAVEREAPKDKAIHAILDNYAVHKHPKVRAWLVRHPRWTFHFTPTSASWLNAVEGFVAKLSRRRLQRGVFHSVVALQTAIKEFVEQNNQSPWPFVWRADPKEIIAAAKRGHQVLETIQWVRPDVRRRDPQAARGGSAVEPLAVAPGRDVRETKRLPADASTFGGMVFEILKYHVVGDVAAGGGEVAAGPEVAAPVALADGGELLLDAA